LGGTLGLGLGNLNSGPGQKKKLQQTAGRRSTCCQGPHARTLWPKPPPFPAVCVCVFWEKREKIAIRRFLCLARKFNSKPKPNCWKKQFSFNFFLPLLLGFCCFLSPAERGGRWAVAGGSCPLPHGRLLPYNSLILLRPCPSPTFLSGTIEGPSHCECMFVCLSL